MAAAILCGFGGAAEQAATGMPPAELAQWEKTLRRAGASAAEVGKFDESVRRHPSEQLPSLEEYLQRTPPLTLVSILRSALRNEQEPTPPAIFTQTARVMSCEALHRISIPDTTIDSASVIASDGSCRVAATVIHPPADNRIKVFIALPTKAWNGRFRGTGGSSYAGGFIESLNTPVTKGYAVGATDTGNETGTASFALDSSGKPAWQRMRDNAYVGIHDMTVVGKALTEAFYGKAPRYSYFVGGSTGGRQALTEAQRYPNDYDGILALYPAIARDRYVPAQLWPQILMRDVNDFLSLEKREAATAAAVEACDGADGVGDGVIDDPTQCAYDPAALIGVKVGDSTFTATDARIIREIWDGPKTHDGRRLWWGPTPGTDLSTLADTGGIPLTGRPCDEGLDWFRYFLALDPMWDWRTLTRSQWELYFEQSKQEYASTYGGDDPDLTGFRDRGGKLLIVHGWADQIVPPQESIAYYESVQQRMAGSRPISEFVRLFMVPGGDHGFEGTVPTPSSRVMISTVMRWVEQGQPPERLDAELMGDHGKPIRTRPLFPYPPADANLGADEMFLGVRVLKTADAGDLAWSVKFPAACHTCQLAPGDKTTAQNAKEFFFHFRAPNGKEPLVGVHIQVDGSKVRGVLVGRQHVTFVRAGDGITVDVPRNGATLADLSTFRALPGDAPGDVTDFYTYFDSPGVQTRVEHADELRRRGAYAAGRWPVIERQAALNLEFAAREAIVALRLDKAVREQGVGTVLLMGFDTNYPTQGPKEAHEDSPPHWHMHLSWDREPIIREVGHFYLGTDGLLVENQVADVVHHQTLRFGPNQTYNTLNGEGALLFSQTITAAGAFVLGTPTGSCRLTPVAGGFQSGVDVSCDPSGMRLVVRAEDDTATGALRIYRNERLVEEHRYDPDNGVLVSSRMEYADHNGG